VKSRRSSKQHHGEILEAAVIKSGIRKKALAEKVGYSRSAYYKHIIDANLPFEILEQYGKVLKHDFSIDLPEMKKLRVEEDPEEYSPPASIEQAVQQRDYWRNKFYTLLEKHQQLLEEKLKK
jgi:hypothetical protein